MGDSWYKLPAEIARRRDLPAVAKLVAAVLLDQADGKPQVRIGVRRIAYLAGCHVETACRSVGELEQIGLVSRIAVVPGSGHRAVYDLHPEALGKPERSENPNSSARKIRTRPDFSTRLIPRRCARSCGQAAADGAPGARTSRPDPALHRRLGGPQWRPTVPAFWLQGWAGRQGGPGAGQWRLGQGYGDRGSFP